MNTWSIFSLSSDTTSVCHTPFERNYPQTEGSQLRFSHFPSPPSFRNEFLSTPLWSTFFSSFFFLFHIMGEAHTPTTHPAFLPFCQQNDTKKEIFNYPRKTGGKRINQFKRFQTTPLCEAGLAGLRSNRARTVSSWATLWKDHDFSYLVPFAYSPPSVVKASSFV